MPDDSVATAAERADQPEVVRLVEASEAFSAALYPPESNHPVDVAGLCAPGVAFLVARDRADGRALGCGAVVPRPGGYGEIKRMFVADAARGRGVGRRLLAALEDAARARGLPLLRLETGVRQPAALALYRAAGYAEVPPFGGYAPDPLFVFMEKRLDGGGGGGGVTTA